MAFYLNRCIFPITGLTWNLNHALAGAWFKFHVKPVLGNIQRSCRFLILGSLACLSSGANMGQRLLQLVCLLFICLIGIKGRWHF